MASKNSLKDKILNFTAVTAVIAFGFFIWQGIFKKEIIPAPDNAVNLEFPLSGGRFYVAYNGPDKDALYGFVHTSALEKYALDIVKDTGVADIYGAAPESSPAFGAPVTSPCSGKVVWVQNNHPDLPVGQKNAAAVANSVTIECNAGFTVVMSHFKQGSVTVNVDDLVKAGDPVAAVGNSGNTAGPHLHIAAFKKSTNNSDTVPLPMKFGGRYLQKGDTVPK